MITIKKLSYQWFTTLDSSFVLVRHPRHGPWRVIREVLNDGDHCIMTLQLTFWPLISLLHFVVPNKTRYLCTIELLALRLASTHLRRPVTQMRRRKRKVTQMRRRKRKVTQMRRRSPYASWWMKSVKLHPFFEQEHCQSLWRYVLPICRSRIICLFPKQSSTMTQIAKNACAMTSHFS